VVIVSYTSVIARIGSKGNPIYIGTGTSFYASETGKLWLGVHDKVPSDNVGSFSVTIKVE